MLTEIIPAELRALPQWIRWKSEPRKPGEAPSKIPYCPIGLSRAKTDDPKTWGDFETASNWLPIGDMAGVGFVFTDAGGLVGIDLDGCLDPESLTVLDWAWDILKRFASTYAEISPSQRGIKIIARGRLPTDRTGKRITLPGSHCGIEAYQRRRFFCITGQLVEGHPSEVADCQETLDWLWATWIAKNPAQKPPQIVSQDDYAVLAIDRGSVARRAAAYLDKVPPGIQGQNGSAATFRAACELFRFGLDDAEAAGLLSQYNARCMPPWSDAELAHKLADARDEVTEAGEFGIRLLENKRSTAASNGQHEKLKPPAAVNEADDDPHRLARVNLARYATRRAGRTLRFWRDEWYAWKDNRYQRLTEKELRGKLAFAIKEEFDRINLEKIAWYEEQKKLGALGDDDKGPPFAQKVNQSLVGNVMQAMAGMVAISPNIELNTWLPTRERKSYLAMANGILDIDALLSGSDNCLLEHSPDWFSTVRLPYAFDPTAECPRWNAFLEHNLELDPGRIKIVQEWAGYLLLSDTSEQRFMILEGEGANGKSVYIAAITAMLGVDNVSGHPLETFGVRFALTDTIGKLLNACGDCGELDKVAEGHLKAFTSGDRMFFDRKGIQGITCAPTARLMVACNTRPRFSDRSQGIWRRMLLIPWNVTITKEKRIKGMDKVEWWNKSGELPGILRWAIVGLARLKAQGGFTESEVMDEAIRDYQEDVNPTRLFLTETLEDGGTQSISSQFLYSLYRSWMENNGYRAFGERIFGKELRKIFQKAEKVRGGERKKRFWAYRGIRFLDEKNEEELQKFEDDRDRLF